MSRNLPEQFSEFSEARQNGFLRVKQLKDERRRVAGIFCTFTPLEILDAAGFISVSLCGMSAETIPAAEADLPKNLCPLIKSSYGFAVSDKCPYTYFSDLIVGETTCDGKKKMYELLGELKPTYILKLPQGPNEDAVTLWTSELKRFSRYLEETFSAEITEEKLRQAVRERNELRRAMLGLMDLQKSVPPPLSGYQMYKTLEGTGFLFRHEDRLKRIQQLRDDVLSAYHSGDRPVSEQAPRILVTGCPIGGVLDKTVKSIEESGAVVVCHENCSGIKAAYQMVDESADDLYQAIAARYLEIGCSVMSPNRRRTDHLFQLIRDFKVDGVVEIDLQACTPYCIESHAIRRLMRELEIPYLNVETDYSQSDSGQLKTRLEAFLERLETGGLG